jgi:hypothetical protein
MYVTYLVFGFLESAIDVIVRFPNSRHTMFVVAEPLLKVSSQFAENDSIGGLLIDFGA